MKTGNPLVVAELHAGLKRLRGRLKKVRAMLAERPLADSIKASQVFQAVLEEIRTRGRIIPEDAARLDEADQRSKRAHRRWKQIDVVKLIEEEANLNVAIEEYERFLAGNWIEVPKE